jgi:hypothetical protein
MLFELYQNGNKKYSKSKAYLNKGTDKYNYYPIRLKESLNRPIQAFPF